MSLRCELVTSVRELVTSVAGAVTSVAAVLHFGHLGCGQMAAAAEVGGGIDYTKIPGLRSSGWPTGGTMWQKIDLVYGNPDDGSTTGSDGGPCHEHEEWRRDLPPRTLENLTWHSDEATAEYRTGSDKKLVGVW